MNIKEIYLMEEPMAAALGAGLDITQPEAKMVVDIGGGTSDMAVISCGKIIAGRSLKIAGDEFDEAVFSYIKRHHNLICGPQTTEHIKRTIGSAERHPEKLSIVARGICNITGLPKSAIVTSEELYPEFSQLLHNIAERIKEVLEECSPQLQADILKNGILLAGGGSLLFGLADYIKKNTGVWAYVAENPLVCVAQGAGRALDFIDKYPDVPEKRVYKKAYIHE